MFILISKKLNDHFAAIASTSYVSTVFYISWINNSFQHHVRKKCAALGKDLGTLDAYFRPHVRRTITDPPYAPYPDVELLTLYVEESKITEALRKRRTKGNKGLNKKI